MSTGIEMFILSFFCIESITDLIKYVVKECHLQVLINLFNFLFELFLLTFLICSLIQYKI